MSTDNEPAGTPKVERPRDEFGRPLPAGEANRLVLPDFDSMTVEECHRRGVDLFDRGVYFGAHEAWESAWRQSRGHPDEAFFQGLSQLGAAYTHYQRGNPRGVRALLERAARHVHPYAPRHRGMSVDGLLEAAGKASARLEDLERGDPLPDIERPILGR